MKKQQLAGYTGSYYQEGKEPIEIHLKDGRLYIRQKHSFISWLKPIAANTFEAMTFGEEQYVFERAANGAIKSLTTKFF